MRISKTIVSATAVLMALVALPAHADEVEVTRSVNLKYAQRIQDLGDQIALLKSKGLLTGDDISSLTERQKELAKTEETVKAGGFQKGATDDLEKSVTQLNADIFKASHRTNPIKPGQGGDEVHDPNLIPAYPDANLKPGSGVVDKK